MFKDVYIGDIIREKVAERGMTAEEFADSIDYARTSVYGIFKRKSVDVELLARISHALGFDFYNEIYLKKGETPLPPSKILITIELNEAEFKQLNLACPEIRHKCCKIRHKTVENAKK